MVRRAPEDYSLDDEVASVLAAVAERGWDRFHLVGYSAGASAALACAAAHGDRLSSLALLDVPGHEVGSSAPA